MRTLCALLIATGPAIAWGQSPLPKPDTPQSSATGAWLVRTASSKAQWIAVLRVSGRHLVGAVSSCSTMRPVEILGGRVEGDTLSFTCASPDGDRTLTFTGRMAGDVIEFTWVKAVRDGGFAFPEDPIFGASSPRSLRGSRMTNPPTNVAEVAARALNPSAVSFDRILRAAEDPANWMTYSGDVRGYRYSPLNQITPANVKDLQIAWLHQTHVPGRSVSTPLVVDGVLYTILPGAPWPSPRNGEVVAMNAATGQIMWTFPISTPRGAAASGGGGRPARGLAILGDRLFLGTLDAHLIALDAFTGQQLWNITVADFADPVCGGSNCYVITHAPLVVKNKVIVGVGGSEGPIRGFIAAFDAETGREAWRFHTIPAPGEAGSDTWAGDSWKTGGGGVWQIGAYDPELNLIYWGTGNPYPVFDGNSRAGDNLYTNSVVALDADTGGLKWHYQFTPHDEWDWDAAQVPVLADIRWKGQPRKSMVWANRNGLLYVLDRATGQFLMGKPFVEVNWMSGFDEKGRPQRILNQVVSEISPMLPGNAATNWYPPAYSPRTGLFYVPAWERGSIRPGIARRGPSYGAVRAFDPSTGDRRWEFIANDARFESGVLATASDLLFVGTTGDTASGADAARLADGYLHALDARTGQSLWKLGLPGSIAPVVTYEVDGRQYVAVAAGNTFFAFALRSPK
jgi:alcohol dehydrogenase (cytochrome c)